jgi:hypothetical protein
LFHGSIGAYQTDLSRQLNHTNDLTSLALCHSTLHTLTIPFIYSRFDIVWPDNASGPEPRAGVDALTYGLSTLVMAEEIYGNRRNQSVEQRVRRRRGNHFASFTKKFSLGNGPPEWVSDCKFPEHTFYTSSASSYSVLLRFWLKSLIITEAIRQL